MLPGWFDEMSHQRLSPSLHPNHCSGLLTHTLRFYHTSSPCLESRRSRKTALLVRFKSSQDKSDKLIVSTEPSEREDDEKEEDRNPYAAYVLRC